MPRFRIVVEISQSRFLGKTFEAEDIGKAKELAEREAWEGEQAEDWDELPATDMNATIRDDLCGPDKSFAPITASPPCQPFALPNPGIPPSMLGVTVIEETTGIGW